MYEAWLIKSMIFLEVIIVHCWNSLIAKIQIAKCPIAKILIAECPVAKILIAERAIVKLLIAEMTNCQNTDCWNTDCRNTDCQNAVQPKQCHDNKCHQNKVSDLPVLSPRLLNEVPLEWKNGQKAKNKSCRLWSL